MRTAPHPSVLTRVSAALVSGPFVVCLAALVTNDRWLKSAYPGVVSGKLSDFAGLAVVGMLLAAAFPARRAVSVDFTDLVAACVLPCCGRLADSAARSFAGWRTVRRLLAVPAGLVAALAVMATSLVQTRQEYSVRPIEPGSVIDPVRLRDVIDKVAAARGLERLSTSGNGALYSGHGTNLKYSLDPGPRVTFEVNAVARGGFLFFGTTPGLTVANELRDDLKRSLAREFPGLEYSEPLRPEPPARPPCVPSPVPSCR